MERLREPEAPRQGGGASRCPLQHQERAAAPFPAGSGQQRGKQAAGWTRPQILTITLPSAKSPTLLLSCFTGE